MAESGLQGSGALHGNAEVHYGVGPPLALATASTLSGVRSVTRCNVSWGTTAHSSRSASLRRGVNVGPKTSHGNPARAACKSDGYRDGTVM